MRIGEFAKIGNITTKMLRHYDRIGLLKPSRIDNLTGYRIYDNEQLHRLNWIIILKNLDFSLAQIKELLDRPVESSRMISCLIKKKAEIMSVANDCTQKKIGIDKLIKVLEREGFCMDKKINLLGINEESAMEIKKNIPNMEMFLEKIGMILANCNGNEIFGVFRIDLSHFKRINDAFGFDVGDKVIAGCYTIIKDVVETELSGSAIGRAAGDEFIVFATASEKIIEQTGNSIIKQMSSYDFNNLGCSLKVGCYIGGLVSIAKIVPDVRRMIEASIEIIDRARSKGKNSVVIISDF